MLPVSVGGGLDCGMLKSWLKLLLVLPNAVRIGSPCPLLGAVPILIYCWAIELFLLLYLAEG